MAIITQDYLKQRLKYYPETGRFLWLDYHAKSSQWNGKYAGTWAGNITNDGYIRITINSDKHYAHILAILYTSGVYPTQEVDHIDRDKKNNKINNLRLVTSVGNSQNASLRCDSTTGVKGVSKFRGGFRAYIQSEGKQYYLGFFKDLKLAEEATKEKREELHGEFACDS